MSARCFWRLIGLQILITLLSVAFASAGTITVTKTTTTPQDTQVARIVARANAATCASVQLPPTCTNAQARAVNPAVTIYSSVNAWAADVFDAALATAVQTERETRSRAEVAAAYDAASASVQAQVNTLLGVQ